MGEYLNLFSTNTLLKKKMQRNSTKYYGTLSFSVQNTSGAYDNKTIYAAKNLDIVTILWDVEPLATV